MSHAEMLSLRSLAGKTLDFLLPPLCLACDAPVSADSTLCPSCWRHIAFIASPYCQSCGMPFEAPVGDGMLCGHCVSHPPTYGAARAAMLYDDASRRLVLSFKHGDRTHNTAGLAAWMHRAGQDLWPLTDCLAPVPLHRWRLFERRYNQSAMLARQIAVLSGKPLAVDALIRHRATAPQGRMNRKGRQQNVKNAFSANPRRNDAIRGKNITLIDDVFTTGATAEACCETLLGAGATRVNVLTLARVRSHT